MITAESWIRVEFDEEGREKIEEAIKTMQDIRDALGKITSGCDWSDDLRRAIDTVQDMLNGEEY